MATITAHASTRQNDCFAQIFGAANCAGSCSYMWDPSTGQYNLQPGSSCSGGAACRSCSPTLPAVVFGLVLLLGTSCFADPLNISFNCGVNLEAAAQTAIRAIRLHRLLVRLTIGLAVVSVSSVAGLCYVLFLR
jgi:hypothetical protein